MHAMLPKWQDADLAQRVDALKRQLDDLYGYTHAAARDRVIAMLIQHPCADEKETRDTAFVISQLREHPNALSSNCEAGHVTGSALIVHDAGRRVLLNHHKKFDRWMQFGGHPELELDPAEVALREATEESGLRDLSFVYAGLPVHPFDVDVHLIPQRGDRPEHFHLDLRYLLQTANPENAVLTDESNHIQWFNHDALAGLPLEPNVRRMISKASLLLGWE